MLPFTNKTQNYYKHPRWRSRISVLVSSLLPLCLPYHLRYKKMSSNKFFDQKWNVEYTPFPLFETYYFIFSCASRFADMLEISFSDNIWCHRGFKFFLKHKNKIPLLHNAILQRTQKTVLWCFYKILSRTASPNLKSNFCYSHNKCPQIGIEILKNGKNPII